MTTWDWDHGAQVQKDRKDELPGGTFQRFGLDLKREDLRQLGDVLNRINEAERTAEREAVSRRIF